MFLEIGRVAGSNPSKCMILIVGFIYLFYTLSVLKAISGAEKRYPAHKTKKR